MPGTTVKIRSREQGEFDCYLALPASDGKAPAVVLACAIMGVDKDMRELVDEFAAQGYIAAAPDLFWRCRGRCRVGIRVLRSAHSRDWRRSGLAKSTWRTRAPTSAPCRSPMVGPQ